MKGHTFTFIYMDISLDPHSTMEAWRQDRCNNYSYSLTYLVECFTSPLKARLGLLVRLFTDLLKVMLEVPKEYVNVND